MNHGKRYAETETDLVLARYETAGIKEVTIPIDTFSFRADVFLFVHDEASRPAMRPITKQLVIDPPPI